MLPLGALGVLLVFGFDVVYERLATLGDAGHAVRRPLGTDARRPPRLARSFPSWAPAWERTSSSSAMFDESLNTSLAAHADNDYAQLLEETGVARRRVRRRVSWQSSSRTSSASAAAGARRSRPPRSAWRSACSRSPFTAPPTLASTSRGVLPVGGHVRAGRPAQPPRSDASSTGGGRRRRVAARRRRDGAGRMAACWTWALRDAYAAHMGEQWWAAAYQIDSSIQQAHGEADDQEFADLLAATEQAVAADPQNVVYAYWLNLFRWQAISRDVDSDDRPRPAERRGPAVRRPHRGRAGRGPPSVPHLRAALRARRPASPARPRRARWRGAHPQRRAAGATTMRPPA